MTQNYIERYWRDAKPEDAIKEPPMVARFKLSKDGVWFYGKLYGIDRTSGLLFVCGKCVTPFCQVYDAPDPGEGWRLVDVDTEQPIVGDEIYDKPNNRWLFRSHDKPYDKELIYRRRIEQPKPEPKYVPLEWEDREQLRGRWIYRTKDGNIIEEIASKFDSRVFNQVAKHLLEDGWHFIDTKEPVGKKVAQ